MIDFETNALITIGVKELSPKDNKKVSNIDQLSGDWALDLRVKTPVTSTVGSKPIAEEFLFIDETGRTIPVTETAGTVQEKTADFSQRVELEWQTPEGEGLIFQQKVGNLKGNFLGTFEWNLVSEL